MNRRNLACYTQGDFVGSQLRDVNCGLVSVFDERVCPEIFGCAVLEVQTIANRFPILLSKHLFDINLTYNELG